MTFRSKALARTKKYDGQTDGRTDGRPKPIGPQPFWLGPKNPYIHNQLNYNVSVFSMVI